MVDVHGRKVNGGSFPATIFNRFMTKATRNVDVGTFTSPVSFTGRILGTKVPFDAPAIDPNVQHVGAITTSTLQHVGPSTTTSRPPAIPRSTTTLVEPPDPGEAPP
jgi:hypothetical protein